MEHILLFFLAVSIFILCLYVPRSEHMTNKDLLATLDRFGKQGTKSSSKDTYQEELYGPKAPKVEEPTPVPASGKSSNDSNVYPDIYGPEITPVPGMTKKKISKSSIHTSDSPDDETYEFNPDFQKAFPKDEDEPQPFLTDFSKFQH